jgi:hypothetical protein
LSRFVLSIAGGSCAGANTALKSGGGASLLEASLSLIFIVFGTAVRR